MSYFSMKKVLPKEVKTDVLSNRKGSDKHAEKEF